MFYGLCPYLGPLKYSGFPPHLQPPHQGIYGLVKELNCTIKTVLPATQIHSTGLVFAFLIGQQHARSGITLLRRSPRPLPGDTISYVCEGVQGGSSCPNRGFCMPVLPVFGGGAASRSEQNDRKPAAPWNGESRAR